MMTWREWLLELTEEEFLESDYFRCMVELLNDPELKDFIAAYRLNIKVVLHPFMKTYEDYFKPLENGNRISLITFDEASIKDEVN